MVFGKLFAEKYYVTQTKLLSFFGICGLILSLITNIISYLIEFDIPENKKEFIGGRLRNIFDYWENINKVLFILTIFLWFIENYLIWFCIYTFDPNHYIIFRNISSILVTLKTLFDDNIFDSILIIVYFFSFGGIFICGLIFNELIIIRICNLEKYTAIELDKRHKEETEKIINFNDDILSNSSY